MLRLKLIPDSSSFYIVINNEARNFNSEPMNKTNQLILIHKNDNLFQ